MQNKDRFFDKTYLSLDLAEERGLVHRDYLAHCLRWSHVVKFLNKAHRYQRAVVLDIGCGKELPLAKLLYVNKMSPRYYVGVDLNKFSIPEMLLNKKIPMSIWSETDAAALDPEDVGYQLERSSAPNPPLPRGFNENGHWEDGNNEAYALPNVVVCFECLEHMHPAHCRQLLKHLQEITDPNCDYFFSTPCYNGSAAGNHVNEMTFSALGALFEDLKFKIEGVYGTFASISDYQSELDNVTIYDKTSPMDFTTTNIVPVFNALRNYYDTNVLSVLFAPLFPAKSRNCLWHLKKMSGDDAAQSRLFSALEVAPTPWSQHEDWKELAG